jgi:hypothetical protein
LIGDKHPQFGMKHSEETIRKIKETLKGKMVGDKHPNFGKPMSEEQKKKMTLMQQLGARRTYSRRYETLTILGLQPQNEDNDASYRQ